MKGKLAGNPCNYWVKQPIDNGEIEPPKTLRTMIKKPSTSHFFHGILENHPMAIKPVTMRIKAVVSQGAKCEGSTSACQLLGKIA